jgi:hypothetical protein
VTLYKVYTKVNLREQKNDFAYWQTQPYQVRLATLEQIREFHHRRYGAVPRFQSLFNSENGKWVQQVTDLTERKCQAIAKYTT